MRHDPERDTRMASMVSTISSAPTNIAMYPRDRNLLIFASIGAWDVVRIHQQAPMHVCYVSKFRVSAGFEDACLPSVNASFMFCNGSRTLRYIPEPTRTMPASC